MTTAVVLLFQRGQRSEGSGHNETDYNPLKRNIGPLYTVELECILNGPQ